MILIFIFTVISAIGIIIRINTPDEIKKCAYHTWVYSEGGSMFCQTCKARPGQS